jgi:hypothetical protein
VETDSQEVAVDAPGQGGAGGSGGVSTTGGSSGDSGIVGAGGVTGSGGASGQGGASSSGGTTGMAAVKLSGTTFGSGPPYNNDPSRTFDKAFDGDTTTFVDDTSVAGYTGIDLGAGSQSSVIAIRYYPREDSNNRMVGGKFQCSGSSPTDGYTDLHTITSVPPLGWTQVTISNSPTCRYLRYLGPTNGFTNVAEIEFWGPGAVAGGGGLPDTGPQWVNLARNKPVMASSQQLSKHYSIYGNDDDLNTGFCASSGDYPVWWLVDLGATYQLVQTDLNVADSTSSYRYQIDVSPDMATWTSVVDQSANTRLGGTMSDAASAQARYVRLTLLGSSNSADWGCFQEFQVWGYNLPGGDAGIPYTNLSLKQPVTASSQFASKPPEQGNDGLLATPFCPSSSASPVWWMVDLGAVHSIAKTEVEFEQQTRYYLYTIDVSSDTTTWTTVVDQSSNSTRNGPVMVDTFTASARYVRITMVGTTAASWGCFWEFTVWGN